MERKVGVRQLKNKARRERVRAQMSRASELAGLIGSEWGSPLSAVEAIRKQRREL
ncbi:MAG: hypothetical protein HY875_06585 [Chloroflexi bacterium]|nr:hypothetical protein [Chloroflexota bacterium]